MTLTTQHILLGNADDRDGMLVFDSDRLVAVLCRLSADHGQLAGHWFVECSFGIGTPARDDFDSLEAACDWLEHAITARESETAATECKPRGPA